MCDDVYEYELRVEQYIFEYKIEKLISFTVLLKYLAIVNK